MRFKIIWVRDFGPETTLDELQNTADHFKITGSYSGFRDIEIEFIDTFNAKSIKQAKQYVKKQHLEKDVEVFTVMKWLVSNIWNKVFDEEDKYFI